MTVSNNRVFDRLFDEFVLPEFASARRSRSQRSPMTMPKVNILESEDGFNVELAAPGREKGDFNIELKEDVLTVSASVANEEEPKTGTYVRREFGVFSFERSFRLPETVDGDKIAATYEGGILRIALPQKEEARPKPPMTISIG